MLAAVMNMVGASLGTGVAETVGSGIIKPPGGTAGLAVVFAAVLGAIAWNIVTWRFGLPSSSTHALIGGLVGAGLAASPTEFSSRVWSEGVIPMLVSPLLRPIPRYLVQA